MALGCGRTETIAEFLATPKQPLKPSQSCLGAKRFRVRVARDRFGFGEPIESRIVLWSLKPPQLPLERKVTLRVIPTSPKSKAVASDRTPKRFAPRHDCEGFINHLTFRTNSAIVS